jgi:hypothetical protein
VRETYLPPDARWVDHAKVGPVTLIQTPATPHARAHEQLFWNASLTRLAYLDQASPIDAFGHPHVRVADDGRLTLGGKTLRGPLAISNFAIRAQLTGASLVARGTDYELWRPAGTPRMSLFVGGLYHDGWLSPAGHLTVYPRQGRVQGTLRLRLALPPKTKATVLQLRGAGVDRRVTVFPGRSIVVSAAVDQRRPWTLSWHSNRVGYLQPDNTPISVQAQMPTFENGSGSATPAATA